MAGDSSDSADLFVLGELGSPNFHCAKRSAEVITTPINRLLRITNFLMLQRVRDCTGKTLSVESLMEFQWSLYKEKLKKVEN